MKYFPYFTGSVSLLGENPGLNTAARVTARLQTGTAMTSCPSWRASSKAIDRCYSPPRQIDRLKYEYDPDKYVQ
jgi:hypothetical protein